MGIVYSHSLVVREKLVSPTFESRTMMRQSTQRRGYSVTLVQNNILNSGF